MFAHLILVDLSRSSSRTEGTWQCFAGSTWTRGILHSHERQPVPVHFPWLALGALTATGADRGLAKQYRDTYYGAASAKRVYCQGGAAYLRHNWA